MRPSIVVAALLLSVLATYANAMEVPFFWDDRTLILVNRVVHEGAPLGDYFTKPFWPDPDEARAFFRPLIAISYRVDFLLHGENAVGFHLTNVAFHLVNVGLLFALLRRWGAATSTSALAAGVFALLPRLTEAVTWVAGRTDVFAATGVLIALLLWPILPIERSRLRACLAALAMLGGLLCKEVALAGVAAVVAFEFAHDPTRRTVREHAIRLTPLAAITVGFLAWHEHVIGGSATGDGLPNMGARLSAACATWGTYAWMLVFPWRPLLQIGRVDEAPPIAVAVGLIVIAGALVVLVKSVVKRDAPTAAGVTMSIVALALVSHVVPIPTSVLCADRFLYVPAVGLALSAAFAVRRVPAKFRPALGALGAVWIALGMLFTFDRNLRMADELGLWMETGERTESANPLPAMELGNVLFRAGEWRGALALEGAAMHGLDQQGKAGGSAWMHAAATAASCFSNLGNYDRARALRTHLIQLQPTSAAWLDLARVALHELDFAASREAILRATASTDAREEGARLLAIVSELDASRLVKEATDTASLVELARFENKAGRRQEAERAWVQVLGRSDVDAVALGEGAAFLAERGSLPAASLASERVRADPRLGERASEIARVVDERRQLAARIDAIRERVQAYVHRLE